MRFLKINAGSAKWAAEGTGYARRFKRSDGKAEARSTTLRGKPAFVVRELSGSR